MFEFIGLFEFMLPEFMLPVFEFIIGVLVAIGVAMLVFIRFMLALLAAVLVLAGAPQAMPSAPAAKTVESTITFFISK